jgi:hypothetical protein
MPPRRNQVAIGLWKSQERLHGGGPSFLLISILYTISKTLEQNLRDEVAMDVDEEEDAENGSTQHPKRVHDYGIEVDFEVLSGEEREVNQAARASTVQP